MGWGKIGRGVRRKKIKRRRKRQQALCRCLASLGVRVCASTDNTVNNIASIQVGAEPVLNDR